MSTGKGALRDSRGTTLITDVYQYHQIRVLKIQHTLKNFLDTVIFSDTLIQYCDTVYSRDVACTLSCRSVVVVDQYGYHLVPFAMISKEVSDLPCNIRRGGREIPCSWRVIPCNIRRKGV